MFTGIVEEVGEVIAVRESAEVVVLTVRGPTVTSDAAHGDSIAVNGVCLTVIDPDGSTEGTFTVELVPETLKRSSLAAVTAGPGVNLERAVAGGRTARRPHHAGPRGRRGHAAAAQPGRAQRRVGVQPGARPRPIRRGEGLDRGGRGVAHRGRRDDDTFAVALIPTTLEKTTLGVRQRGIPVNIEVDVIAKYVEKLAAGYLRAHGCR